VLQNLDKSLYDYYLENLESIEKRIAERELENNSTSDDEIQDFFYFRKQIEGYYQYHLFPKLDLNLIEDKTLMGTCARKKYIKQVISALKTQKASHSVWSLQEDQKTKQNPGQDANENQKDP